MDTKLFNLIIENMQIMAQNLETILKLIEKQNEINNRITEWMDKYPDFKEFMEGYNCGGYQD